MTIIRKADFLRKELEIPLSHPVLSTCTSVLFLEKNDVKDKTLLLHSSKYPIYDSNKFTNGCQHLRINFFLYTCSFDVKM